MLSNNESLSRTTVHCESAFILFNEIPELKILSFSYLNGIMANEISPLSDSLQISDTTGDIAEPVFPAKLVINMIVE